MRTTRYAVRDARVRPAVFHVLRPWVLAMLWLCTTLAHAQTTSPLTLFHRFEVGVGAGWESVRLPLRSDEWRIGWPEGPLANPEQLRSVLESLGSVVIGCRCAGADVGAVHYPSYLELARPQIDDRPVALGASADRWRSTSGDTLLTFATGVILATSVSQGEQQQAKPAALSDVLTMEAGFLGLVAPQSFVAGLGAAGARGLSFDIRARSGPLAAAKIEPLSGLLILSTQRLKADPAPRRSVRGGDAT